MLSFYKAFPWFSWLDVITYSSELPMDSDTFFIMIVFYTK